MPTANQVLRETNDEVLNQWLCQEVLGWHMGTSEIRDNPLRPGNVRAAWWTGGSQGSGVPLNPDEMPTVNHSISSLMRMAEDCQFFETYSLLLTKNEGGQWVLKKQSGNILIDIISDNDIKVVLAKGLILAKIRFG